MASGSRACGGSESLRKEDLSGAIPVPRGVGPVVGDLTVRLADGRAGAAGAGERSEASRVARAGALWSAPAPLASCGSSPQAVRSLGVKGGLLPSVLRAALFRGRCTGRGKSGPIKDNIEWEGAKASIRPLRSKKRQPIPNAPRG